MTIFSYKDRNTTAVCTTINSRKRHTFAPLSCPSFGVTAFEPMAMCFSLPPHPLFFLPACQFSLQKALDFTGPSASPSKRRRSFYLVLGSEKKKRQTLKIVNRHFDEGVRGC